MSKPQPAVWYREPTMMIVIAVLSFSVISGFTMLGVALSTDDTLILSEEDYQTWRDDIRATKPINADDD